MADDQSALGGGDVPEDSDRPEGGGNKPTISTAPGSFTGWRFLMVVAGAGLAMAAYLLPLPGLSTEADRMLAIFVFIAVLWLTEAIPLYATAFLIPFLLVALDILGSTASLAPFFHPVIALLLGGFMLSIAINKYGLDKKMATAILVRVGGRPRNILFAVMGITAFLSMWLSNTATTAIMIAIILPIVDQFPPGDRFGRALILSVPFAANIGGMGTPVGTTPNPMAISYLAENGIRIAFVDWMLLAVPLQILFLAVVVGVLWLLFHPWGGRRDLDLAATPPIDGHGKWVIAITLLTVGLWLTSKLHGVPDSIIALVPVVLFLGTKLLSGHDFGKVRWDVLALIGGGLALGVGMRDSGLDLWMVEQISVGGLHPMLIMLLFSALAAGLTTFMSNTATAALLIPVVGSFGLQFGMSTQMVLAVAIISSSAMALPVSTPPNAIAYGSGRIKIRELLAAGGLITLLCIGIISLVGEFWWGLLGY